MFRCDRGLTESKVLDSSLTEGVALPPTLAAGRRKRKAPQWEEDGVEWRGRDCDGAIGPADV